MLTHTTDLKTHTGHQFNMEEERGRKLLKTTLVAVHGYSGYSSISMDRGESKESSQWAGGEDRF